MTRATSNILASALNDKSATQEWHAAKTLEYKGRSHVAPREKPWFIYKLLGSMLSNSSRGKHCWCMLVLLPKWKKLKKEPEPSSPMFLPDKRHLICPTLYLSKPSTIRWSSSHCKIKVMRYTNQLFSSVCDWFHVLTCCSGLMPVLLTSRSR